MKKIDSTFIPRIAKNIKSLLSDIVINNQSASFPVQEAELAKITYIARNSYNSYLKDYG
ncbi:MAG TPA: hypothetical protein VJR94_02010 [Candidatus Nitrosocosmicus sp.]|nr:hypothetical protein [Candidatus Nitrosocosmicus sp.]